MDIFQPCYDFQEAAMVRQLGLYPYFQVLAASDGPVVQVDGRECVMLGSNNYLGLTHHPEVMEASKAAVDRFGAGCTGSRFLNGNLALHEELERELARFFRKEAALVYSSGFLANAGVLSTLGSHEGAVIFSENENHASLIEGVRHAKGEVRIFHDLDDLERQLSEQERWPNALVITEGVFSMTGRVSDLRRFAALRRRFGFKLYLDDAHGIGVMGEQGRGAAAAQGVEDDVDLLFGTFSKSLASLGGFVAGDPRVIDYLRHKTRTLMFTAALPPASAAAALTALRVMQHEPALIERLHANAAFLRDGLTRIGYHTMGSQTPILPLFIGSESLAIRMCCELLELGVFTTPVAYPAVPLGQAMIRTSTMPAHTREHLEKALDALAAMKQRYPIPEVENGAALPKATEMDFSYFFSASPQGASQPTANRTT